MIPDSDKISLHKFIEHLLQEAVRSDAQAQILQQTGWMEFRKAVGGREGIDIAEGMGKLEYLGLREIKVSFVVEPVQPGFWSRVKYLFRYLLGKPAPPAIRLCRLVSGTPVAESAFSVSITVSRSADGTYAVATDPGKEDLGGVYVADITT